MLIDVFSVLSSNPSDTGKSFVIPVHVAVFRYVLKSLLPLIPAFF